MNEKRKTGTVLGMGGVAAAVALLVGLPAAQADELSDLRANQELLQKRIAQLEAAAKADPAVQAGSFKPIYYGGSFLMPGTDTSISVSGYVKFDAAYWLHGAPTVNGNVQTPTFGSNGAAAATPLDLHGQKVGGLTFSAPAFNPHSRGNGVFEMTARQSRFHVSTRTPTAYGPAGTDFEFDFFGCNNFSCSNLNHVTNPIIPRLRHAYGTLGPWLLGQTWVPTDDLQAHPETFDFGGPVGEFGYSRAPQARYTWSGPYGLTAIVAAVEPETDAFTPAGSIESDTSPVSFPAALAVNPTKASAPDGNFVLQLNRPWGHFRIHGIVHDLKLEDGRFISKEYIGYGGGFAGNVRPDWFGWRKDGIGYEFFAGNGLGRYANGQVGFNALATNFGCAGPAFGCKAPLYGATGGPTTLAAAKLITATTVTQFGGQVNYAHWWTPTLRSTGAFGYLHQDVPFQLIGPTQAGTGVNRTEWTAHFNLIWSPVAFIDTGIEWVHAHRRTVSSISGDADVIDYAFQVKF